MKMHSRHVTQRRWLPIVLMVQAILIAALLVPAWAKALRLDHPPQRPALRSLPATLPPLYDLPQLVSDEQLDRVLEKLQPRLARERPSINHVDHALRFWGADATFADPAALSGQEMLAILTDDHRLKTAWGDKVRPLLIHGPLGLSVRTQQGEASASHVDHTLATLAEIGLPLEQPIMTSRGTSDLRRLLHQATDSFSLNQVEYEWSVLAMALYAASGDPWVSREGQHIDFNRQARRIIRQPCADGVCFGNHRLYTLAALLRLDAQADLLTSETESEIVAHMQEATQRLVASQAVAGYWDANWPDISRPVRDARLGEQARRILATGHALEWWAIAPAELHPPRETLVRAAQWLVVEIEAMELQYVASNYTFLSHAGRALALWRGKLPAQWLRERRPALPEPSPASPERT